MIGNGLLASPKDAALGAALIVVLIFVFAALWLLTGFKKCPSDKILVVIGKLGTNPDGSPQTVKCIHGGAVFVVPFVQRYYYLDLTPLRFPLEIKKAVFSDGNSADMSFVFTVAVSTEPAGMKTAAERLLLLPREQIKDLALDIICGQIRLAAAETEREEIKKDRDAFFASVCKKAEGEIAKIGLVIINANWEDFCERSEKSAE